MERLQTEESERNLEKESYIQLSDEMTSAKILISTSILEYLIKSQSHKSKLEMATFKLDENIIKTMVKKKMFYDAMINLVEYEKRSHTANTNKKTATYVTNSTNESESFRNFNGYWPLMYDEHPSSGCQTPRHVNYNSLFEFKNDNCRLNKNKLEEMSIKELNNLDYNLMDNSYFTEDDISFTDEATTKKLMEDDDKLILSEQMKELLNKEDFSSHENFDF